MEFHGFEHLAANYLYCPNQFFEVCLPNQSRGTVRLVAYLLRKTLGWLDHAGNPVEQDISISYRDLIDEAGISRGAIRKALDDAVAGRFIVCLQAGKANTDNQSAETARYALRWSAGNSYCKTVDSFDGFFAGEGYRTPIPNSFFDRIVKSETLSVVKVVGTVLRHTVGYQNQFGGRRQIAPLSYSYILKYTNLSDRTTLSSAIRHAIETGYIRCVQKGRINLKNRQRSASTYAICWQEEAVAVADGTKTRPVNSQQFKKQTDDGSETRPIERFKNPTEEKPQKNNTDKQHEPVIAVENLDETKKLALLRHAGFDDVVALELSTKRGLDAIQKQIDWLPYRNTDRNPLGMLRKAIQGNWSKPETVINNEQKQQRLQKDQKQAAHAAIENARVLHTKQQKKLRREQCLPIWNSLNSAAQSKIKQTVYEQLNSDFLRDRFQKHDEFRLNQCLDALVKSHKPNEKTAKHSRQ